VRHSKGIHRLVPIFIGGTGRSGTTVLGDLLNEHSLVRTSNPTEIKFLANRGGFLDVVFGSMSSQIENREKISILHYRTIRERAQKDLLHRSQRFDEFSNKIWGKWWEIDGPAPHGPGLHVGIEKEDLHRILSEYSNSMKKRPLKHATKFMESFIALQKNHKGEKYWAETTPMNIAYSHRLTKLFPAAKFIVIRRDPRDVIASLLTKDWGPNTSLEGVAWIESRLRADNEALRAVDPNKVLTIHLEDLVTNSPEETYLKILDFLGLQDESAMRKFRITEMTPENASLGRWKNEINTPGFSEAIESMNVRLKKDNIF
jgi:hypothetical protein